MEHRTLHKSGTLRLTIPTYVDEVLTTPSNITVTSYLNGSATGDSITPSLDALGTGLSTITYTPTGTAAGDTLTLKISATVSGTTRLTVVDVMIVGVAQSGDSYARLGAPAGASVSADVAAVLAAVQANGGGSGARSVSITVNDGTTVLTSAKVRVSQGSESYMVPTNGSGVSSFNLDDATWTVRVTKPGYTLAAQTLVVDGAETVTYSMTAVSVSTPSAPNLSVGTLLCLGTDGLEEAGAKVYFRLIEGPGTAGYSLDATEWYETADADGQIEAEFIIGATYGAHRGDVGREVKFTVANGASFSLPENLGSP